MTKILTEEEVAALLKSHLKKPCLSEIGQLGTGDRLVKIFSDNIVSVFHLLTGRVWSIQESYATFRKRDLAFRASYEKGLSGDIFFCMSNNRASVLADLVCGGDGEPSEVNDDVIEVLIEVFKQILSSANQYISDILCRSISCPSLCVVEDQRFDEYNCFWLVANSDGISIPIFVAIPVSVYSALHEQLGSDKVKTGSSNSLSNKAILIMKKIDYLEVKSQVIQDKIKVLKVKLEKETSKC